LAGRVVWGGGLGGGVERKLVVPICGAGGAGKAGGGGGGPCGCGLDVDACRWAAGGKLGGAGYLRK
jgi:hypothetical protein